MTRTQGFLLATGGILIGLGLLFGAIISVSTSGTSGQKSCGTPWNGKDPVIGANFSGRSNLTDYAAECSDARQTRGTIALISIGLGGAAVAGAFVVDRKRVGA